MISKYPFRIFGHTFSMTFRQFMWCNGLRTLFALAILVLSITGIVYFGNEYLNGYGSLLATIYVLCTFTFETNGKKYGVFRNVPCFSSFSWIISYGFSIYAVMSIFNFI